MNIYTTYISGSIVLLLSTLIVTGRAYAITATVSAAPNTTTLKQKQIDDLKERVATKVAQLRQSEKRAMYGTVKSTSLSSLTVETPTKDVKIELTDTILVAQIIKDKRTKLAIDDVSKGDVVTVFGDYDTTLDILRAKAIYIQTPPPMLVYGAVTDVNKKDFTLTLSTALGQTYVVDIEKITKTLVWSKEKGIVKAGFSTITIGDSVHVAGTTEPKKDNSISAMRVLSVGNLTGAPGPSPTPTLIPISTKIATPTATLKPTAKP